MPTQTQTPNFFPFTRYADANGAIEWLTQAFGFNERVAYRGDEGKVHHAEMHLDPGIFMLGEGDPAEQGCTSPSTMSTPHYARAKAAGAEIVREIEDTPYDSRESRRATSKGTCGASGTTILK